MYVSALVDQSGRPIADHQNVNLLVDDLEEVITVTVTVIVLLAQHGKL